MNGSVFYSAGHTKALDYAVQALKRHGCCVIDKPDSRVTHLLLDVPSFGADGYLRGGGNIEDVLTTLNANTTIVGGNLQHSALSCRKVVDLLKDPIYLSENADITAHCAVKLALSQLPITLKGCQVLVIGWGRIGKCLSKLLKNMGAIVTVATRKDADRAMLQTLGYDTENSTDLNYGLARYRVIFNTAPSSVISEEALAFCHPSCLMFDLASEKGIAGSDVIWARGLPGKDAPETSGELIARSILRLRQKGELL